MGNSAKKLPDAYRKDTDGNVYKLLQLANLLFTDERADLNSINNSRDLYTATGKTLDNYGAMVGETRNGTTDDQYRTKILSKIYRNISGADCNSVITAIAQIFDVEPSAFKMKEANRIVTIIGLTMEMLENSGYTTTEIDEMLKGLIPVGVGLHRTMFAGTLLINIYIDFLGPAEVVNEYPRLYSAWAEGQLKYILLGEDVGLSGYGEVPETWNSVETGYRTSGTYSGGTLGILSGED